MAEAPVIAIDGPGGSGKGTLCRWLATTLGWHYLDSGALYRLLALKLQKAGAPPERAPELAQDMNIRFALDTNEVWLDGDPVADRIRGEDVGALASTIAVDPSVRAALLARQRDFRRPPGLVADGRDMATVVFPQAPLKIFLDASTRERAQRRCRELLDSGKSANFEKIFREISERDRRDRQRAVAPLRPAEDSVVIDSTGMAIEAVCEQALMLARERGLSR